MLFTDQNSDSLAQAVQNFNSKDFDSKEIRAQAENFSKDRFKREMKDLLEKEIADYFSKKETDEKTNS